MLRFVCYFNKDGLAVFCIVSFLKENMLIDCTRCKNKGLHDDFVNKMNRIKYVEI